MLHGKLTPTMSERQANRVKIRKLTFEVRSTTFALTKLLRLPSAQNTTIIRQSQSSNDLMYYANGLSQVNPFHTIDLF